VLAERRAAPRDREVESLARRVTTLERLSERVTRLEAGPSSPVARGQPDMTSGG